MQQPSEKNVEKTPLVRSDAVRLKTDRFGSWRFKGKWASLSETEIVFQKSKTSPARGMRLPLSTISAISRVDLKRQPYTLLLTTTSSAFPNAKTKQRSRRYFLSLSSDKELYDWQDDIYSRAPMLSGDGNEGPTNFVHQVHVGFDQTNGAFSGIPSQWSHLLAKTSMNSDGDGSTIQDPQPQMGAAAEDVREKFFQKGPPSAHHTLN